LTLVPSYLESFPFPNFPLKYFRGVEDTFSFPYVSITGPPRAVRGAEAMLQSFDRRRVSFFCFPPLISFEFFFYGASIDFRYAQVFLSFFPIELGGGRNPLNFSSFPLGPSFKLVTITRSVDLSRVDFSMCFSYQNVRLFLTFRVMHTLVFST